MTAATIIVLVIGVILIVVSFFLTGSSEETPQEERMTPGMPDELTEADKKQLRKLTDTFIRDYSKKQVKEIARNTIDSRVQDAVAAKQPAIEDRVSKIDLKLDEADAKIDEMENKAASLGDGLATYAGQIASGWDQNQTRVNEVLEKISGKEKEVKLSLGMIDEAKRTLDKMNADYEQSISRFEELKNAAEDY
ncbi:MAG: hypothetical protein J6O53_05045, partial [Eubacterium sp.]|nr:hypothetical protein [Eubacterium sp.]